MVRVPLDPLVEAQTVAKDLAAISTEEVKNNLADLDVGALMPTVEEVVLVVDHEAVVEAFPVDVGVVDHPYRVGPGVAPASRELATRSAPRILAGARICY